MAGNFAALWPTDPKFSALKDLKPFKTVPRVQEAGCILRVGFTCSKWPHLHRAYVVTVRKLNLHSVRQSVCTYLVEGYQKWGTLLQNMPFGKCVKLKILTDKSCTPNL